MQFIDDVRYAVRQFAHAPGFTATAVLTLALGIGATTAIFTLVHAVLLKSLPVAKPSELIRIGDNENCCVNGGLQENWSLFSYDKYKTFRDGTTRVHRTGRLPGRTRSLWVFDAAGATSRPNRCAASTFRETTSRCLAISAYAGRMFTRRMIEKEQSRSW